MRYIVRSILTICIFFLFTNTSLGADEKYPLSPLAVKTIEIVDAAYAYVQEHSGDMAGVQKALQNDPRFFDRENELYIFIHCYNAANKEAICCGQGVRPELIGKNMWHLRTPNGRLLFAELTRMIEQDGEGWIEYDWLNPFTKKIQTKRSYAKGIVLKDGRTAWVGCGYWKE
jgi:cytochrome c